MLDSLLSQLLTYAAESLDAIMKWLFGIIDMNINFFTEQFPIVTTLYGIIQSVGVGLAIAIALFQLSKYLTGPLANAKSSPLEILFRLGISLALIFFGNYLLEAIINLFSYPHQALINISQFNSSYGNTFTNLSGNSVFSVFFMLILIIIVGWNVIKLVLEVLERFVLIGVLTYLSPLAWSAATSRESQPIMFKYLSMFFGQCLLMLLSVWSAKMVVSIIGNGTGDILISCCMALAFCKVAQRFDTYMQTMGINAAHTGSSWMDDILVAGRAITGVAGAAVKSSGNNILGDAIQKGGIVGGIAVGASQIGSFVSSGVRNFADNGINIDKNKIGGGFSVSDSMGGMDFTAKTRSEANRTASIINSTRAKYQGESNMTKDEKGMYNWTDANGNTHQFKDFNDAVRNQEAIRKQYDPTQVSKINNSDNNSVQNDGTINKVNLNSEPGDNISGMSNVYADRVVNQDGSINEKSINADSKTFTTKEGADTALTISALAGSGLVNGQTAQQLSQVSANTIASQGASTAATLMNLKQGNGPITDERVVRATYDKLFDNNISKNELDGWMPGFTEAMEGNSIANLSMGDGMISGIYTDGSGMDYGFNIVSQQSYNSMPEDSQVDYQPIQGADGSMYYANVVESTNMPNELGGSEYSKQGSFSSDGTASISSPAVESDTARVSSVEHNAPIPVQSEQIQGAADNNDIRSEFSTSSPKVDIHSVPIQNIESQPVSYGNGPAVEGDTAHVGSVEHNAPLPVQSAHIQGATDNNNIRSEFNTSNPKVEVHSVPVQNIESPPVSHGKNANSPKYTTKGGNVITDNSPHIPMKMNQSGKILGENNNGNSKGKSK